MNRTALITGASRGIGAAVARELAKRGHHIIINYQSNHEAAEATLSDVQAAGGTGQLCAFDVRDRTQVTEAFAALESADCKIEILVNNAGIADDGPFPAMDGDAWERVTRTTLDGFFNVTQPLVMGMARRRWGRIINMSSVSGVMGNRGQVNYSAAKAGLIGATRSLAIELAKRKVTVNAVAPGLIETDMISEAPVAEILPHIPMRRLGKPEEVAALVGFLCEDAAAYITGQVIGINGGLA